MYLILSLVIFIYYVYQKISSVYSYWSKKKIIGPTPSFVVGNMIETVCPQKYSLITLAAKYYNDYPNQKVVGIYQGMVPTLVVRDPEMIRTVIVKDFSRFNSRGLKISNEWSNLFIAEDDEWKTMRKDLTSSFTSAKLKAMMPMLNTCIEKHMDYMEKNLANLIPVEVRKLNIKYAITTISSVALGVDFETHAEKTTEVEHIAIILLTINLIRRFGYLLNNLYPGNIVKYLYLQYKSQYSIFFDNLSKNILQERENNPQERQDLMEKLIAVQKREELAKENGKTAIYNDNTLSAQTLLFFGAGFETSSSSMSFFLYELALHPMIQDRCLEEIDTVMEKYNGKPDYDALMKELPYVSMVMDETLRKYPIGGLLSRESTTDYTFKELNLTISKGTKLWCSILGLHNDPKYFEEPEKFDPDRFLPENFKKIREYYYPFGDGPRICIGMQFARLQFLLGISHMLHKFKVSPCEKTDKKIKFDPRILTLAPEGGIWLNVEKRNRS